MVAGFPRTTLFIRLILILCECSTYVLINKINGAGDNLLSFVRKFSFEPLVNANYHKVNKNE
jgi:hypothetical protein